MIELVELQNGRFVFCKRTIFGNLRYLNCFIFIESEGVEENWVEEEHATRYPYVYTTTEAEAKVVRNLFKIPKCSRKRKRPNLPYVKKIVEKFEDGE